MRRLVYSLLLAPCSLLLVAPAAAQWSLVAEYSQVDSSPFKPDDVPFPPSPPGPEALTFRWALEPTEYAPPAPFGSVFWQADVTAADVGRTYEATLNNFDAVWFSGTSFWSMFEVADLLLGPSFEYPIVGIAERTVPIDRVTVTVDDWQAFIRDDGIGVAIGAITARFYTAVPEPATVWPALVMFIASLMSRHRCYSG
jgi:hypothetical protein